MKSYKRIGRAVLILFCWAYSCIGAPLAGSSVMERVLATDGWTTVPGYPDSPAVLAAILTGSLISCILLVMLVIRLPATIESASCMGITILTAGLMFIFGFAGHPLGVISAAPILIALIVLQVRRASRSRLDAFR
ncbi:hypothetical protein [Coriobacterium glomerans]|nr:hypothetical protein [Coriobacterium glomerans]